jgi:A/G-specific adenine glycosylase
VPGTEWTQTFDAAAALAWAPPVAHNSGMRWRQLHGVVTHTFTHFPLELVVFALAVPAGTPAPEGMRWVRRDALPGEALPSLMRKVVAHADAKVS